jgi:quinol monooxygenase YgiN
MAIQSIARFTIRPDAREAAERAMHAYADYVRKELPDTTWTMFRDPHTPGVYVAMSRADDAATDARQQAAEGTAAFRAAIEPLLVAPFELTACELVTSSDLQRRFEPRRGSRRPPRR